MTWLLVMMWGLEMRPDPVDGKANTWTHGALIEVKSKSECQDLIKRIHATKEIEKDLVMVCRDKGVKK